MNIRAALTAALVVPTGLVTAAPVAPTYAAAALCQGQPATIESAAGSITGTEGNDVIVATTADVTVQALGGNDLVCVVGGRVSTGEGDDSVVSSAPAGGFTEVNLHGGNDSYVDTHAGHSRVYVSEVTGLRVDFGTGGGDVWLYPTATAGTGKVEFGVKSGRLFAMGESEAHVDLAQGTAGVDNLLAIKVVDLYDATATGAVVRMVGNAWKNELAAAGCDVVVNGGEGRDVLSKVGGGVDRGASDCPRRDFRSVLKGGLGPDRLSGRATDDLLLGGPGRDVAEGKGGRDRCVAEVERNCER
jgi:Ca2+-binding RTX toxin-like protein